MKFLNPSMFLLASALPVVAIFYMLKMKAKDTPVSSIYLWQNLLKDMQANTPWQRLKPNILMLLQLLLLLTLIISLASPAISRIAISSGNIILIIDDSQSMATVEPEADEDGSKSRLDYAKLKAKEIIEQAPDRAMFSLISSSDKARIAIVNSQDRGSVLKELDNLKPEGSSTDPSSAINIGASIVKRYKDGRIYLISDGCFPKLDNIPHSPVKFINVGRQANNIAIQTASLLESPDPPHAAQLFVSIKNNANSKKKALLSIYSNGRLIDSKRLNLAKRSIDSVVFKDGLSGLEAVEIRLDCDDLLDVDNQAWVLKSTESIKNIFLVSTGNGFLEEGIHAVTSANISVIHPRDWKGIKSESIVIFDGFIPDKLPDCNSFIVNPPVKKGKAVPFNALGYKKISSVEALDPNHPILRFADLSEIRIARLKDVTVPGWMRPVVIGKPIPEKDGKNNNKPGVVIAAGEESARRVALLALDLSDSDLPLRIAYPILLANIIDYLRPNPSGKSSLQMSIGDSIVIKPVTGATSIAIDYPDGNSRELEKEKQVFQDTQLPGIYHIRQTIGDKVISEPFAVSMISKGESDITPFDHPELVTEQSSKAGTGMVEKVDVNLWHWVALIALLLLLVEGWVYMKGY